MKIVKVKSLGIGMLNDEKEVEFDQPSLKMTDRSILGNVIIFTSDSRLQLKEQQQQQQQQQQCNSNDMISFVGKDTFNHCYDSDDVSTISLSERFSTQSSIESIFKQNNNNNLTICGTFMLQCGTKVVGVSVNRVNNTYDIFPSISSCSSGLDTRTYSEFSIEL